METNHTERDIGRIEGKLDLVISQVGELNKNFRVLESGRISRLETQLANLTAKMGIIIATATVLANGLLFIIEHFLIK